MTFLKSRKFRNVDLKPRQNLY